MSNIRSVSIPAEYITQLEKLGHSNFSKFVQDCVVRELKYRGIAVKQNSTGSTSQSTRRA